jgi:hypothetical protein
MTHDLRRQIWDRLVEGVASPKEIADELGADLDDVSYHTRRLVELDCAEKVSEKKVRGAVQHFYRATKQVVLDDEEWLQLLRDNPRLAEHQIGTFMQVQLDDYRKSILAGVLGSDDRFLIDRTPVVVDEAGCNRILEELDRFERETLPEIVRESAERRSDTGADRIHMSVCLSAFKTPPAR